MAAGAKREGGWATLSRAIAAFVAGYFFAATATALLARSLPMERSEATIAATMASIFVYVAAILWAFMARSVWKVWALLGGTSALGAGYALWRGMLP